MGPLQYVASMDYPRAHPVMQTTTFGPNYTVRTDKVNPEVFHRTQDGRVILISNMDDAHLLNTIKMYRRKLKPYDDEFQRRNKKVGFIEKLRARFKMKHVVNNDPNPVEEFLQEIDELDKDSIC
jgi:hypothetical protein